MKLNLLNQKGVGLTQVMFASVLLMGVSIGVFNLIESETKKLTRKSKDLVVTDFHKEIIDNFSNPASCLKSVNNGSVSFLSSFSGNNKLNIPSIKNQLDVVIYTPNPSTGSMLEGVRFTSSQLKSYDPTLKVATLVNTFVYPLGPKSKVTKYKQTLISITPDITGTKVENCVLSGKDAGAGDVIQPSVAINQATTQVDPTVPPISTAPVLFDIEFSEPINIASFTTSDITFSGTAVVSTWELVNSGNDTKFSLKVTGTTVSGTIIPNLVAGAVQDLAGNDNKVSTATDNSVLVQIPATLAWVNPGTVEDFGGITADETININLKNTGEVTSKVIQLTSPTGNWTLGPTNTCQGNTLAKNQECTVQVNFGASTSPGGNFNYDLTASETGGGSSATVNFSVSVLSTTLEWQSPQAAFGTNVCDKTIMYTLKNIGTNWSNKITVTTTNATKFEILEDTCSNIMLAQNSSCTLKVNFKATGLTAGSYSSVLSGKSFNSIANTVNLSGTKGSTDPCAGSPNIGDVCSGCNMIYAGTYNSKKYFVTKSGCSNNPDDYYVFTPTCSGSIDSVTKTWNQGSGGVDITLLPNYSVSDTDPNSGSLNTNLIDNMPDPHKAARYCQNMILNGFDDWFLPTKNELNLLYTNKDLVGGFNGNNYWSSTENSALGALYLDFPAGTFGGAVKTSSFSVRCVRIPDCFGTTAPPPGTLCSDGTIFAGELNGIRYLTTKGGCTNITNFVSQFTPTCSGSSDSFLQPFNDGTTSYDFPEIPNTSCPLNTLSGEFSTGIAADYPTTIHKAPRYCKNMVYAGRPDWFMPGIEERMMLWNNKASIEGMTTGPTDYHTTSEYTTPTQLAATVWCGSGANYQSKNFSRAIRCLRKWNPNDPCHGVNPTVGASCTGGAKYAGTLTVGSVTARYMVTPGGCADYPNTTSQFNGSCTGSTDSVLKKWNNGTDTGNAITPPDGDSGEFKTTKLVDVNTAAEAAIYCQNLMFGGYSDWFLPNIEELNLIYSKKAILGGFTTAYAYWSSSEAINGKSWTVTTSGVTGAALKAVSLAVRCVRRY
jgi:Protein of unknown function (DUF1566)